MEIVNTRQDPFILYVEGEDDERILNAWASVLGRQPLLKRFYIKKLGGGSKKDMCNFSGKHFDGLTKIVPNLKHIILFDYDSENSYHPEPNNPVLFEWKRRNIENYLLVPDTWQRSALAMRKETDINLFNNTIMNAIETFFNEQNLTLPKTKTWRDVSANIFSEVNGKKILFENKDSLFQILRERFGLIINRVDLCNSFLPEELHQDVIDFFDKLEAVIKSAPDGGQNP
ncbi:hypothetical protein [Candidatus Magnetominusculus dajiuhuensis]|uniref:hypothetical protein n=1 Tax=Candidatus Magnetominusculus dajiuhuensis TaxID=3137712 RepID=UPI003B436CB9